MKIKLRHLVLAVASVACAVAHGAPASADEVIFPTNEALRHIRDMDDPQLSPDGAHVLIRVQDTTADGGRMHLWLVDTQGAAPRQLTFSPDGDRGGEFAGQWTADGQAVLFLAHRVTHTGLFRLPINGGEATALDIRARPTVNISGAGDTSFLPEVAERSAGEVPLDINAYRISPDGAWIALITRDPEMPAERRAREEKADAIWVDHEAHGSCLYLYRPTTGEIRQVPVPNDVVRITWSQDGAHFIAISEGANHLGDLGPARSAWLVDTASPSRPKKIEFLPPTLDRVVFSNDGRSLVFLAQAPLDAPPLYNDLFIAEGDGKTIRDLSAGIDGTVFNSVVGTHFDLTDEPVPLAGGGVVQLIERGTDIRVALYHEHQDKPSWIDLPLTAVLRARTNPRRTGWLFFGSSSGSGPRLLYADELAGPTRALLLPDLASVPYRSVSAKRVHWRNKGLTIEGLLYLPPANADHASPLIVEVHGGPTFSYVDAYDPFVDFLLGHGWAVLRTNPRGSTGRGVGFASANKNDLGGADYADIMAGVDHVLATEPLDAKRTALIGYSYGGEMAAFAEGKTTRFRAIVSGGPVIDQYSEYGTEEDSWGDRWFFGKPSEKPADAWRQSPLAGARRSKTPFLLLQGLSDTADPPGQSQEMYRALRQAGTPVSLVMYPREDHVSLLLALYGHPTGEPWHGFDARRRIEQFVSGVFADVR